MVGGLVLTGLLLTQTPTPAAPPTQAVPVLGELHAVQVDAHLSRLRALQAEIALQQMRLQQERAKIDAVIAVTYPGYELDWGSGQLIKAKPGKDETP